MLEAVHTHPLHYVICLGVPFYPVPLTGFFYNMVFLKKLILQIDLKILSKNGPFWDASAGAVVQRDERGKNWPGGGSHIGALPLPPWRGVAEVAVGRHQLSAVQKRLFMG